MASARKTRGQNGKQGKPSYADILRVVRSVSERKAYVGGANSQTTSNTGTVWALSQGVVQGDAINSRDGTQITLQQVHVKADVFMPTATVAAGVRMIVFTDTQNNGTLPGVTEVLNATSMISPYSLIQQVTNRFRIHADVVKNLTAGGIQQVLFDIKRDVTQKISYNGATDVAASNGKNAVFMLIITDVGSGFPTYDFSHNLRFLDM